MEADSSFPADNCFSSRYRSQFRENKETSNWSEEEGRKLCKKIQER